MELQRPMSQYSPFERTGYTHRYRDGCIEVGRDGGTSVTRLTLDGEQSLDADLSDQSSDHEGGNPGREENERETTTAAHACTHAEDGVQIVRSCTARCNHRQPGSTRRKIRGFSAPDCILYPECTVR
jgi:hypothetical protein